MSTYDGGPWYPEFPQLVPQTVFDVAGDPVYVTTIAGRYDVWAAPKMPALVWVCTYDAGPRWTGLRAGTLAMLRHNDCGLRIDGVQLPPDHPVQTFLESYFALTS